MSQITVQNDLEELHKLATVLNAILSDARQTLSSNRQEFAQVSRDLNDIVLSSAGARTEEESAVLAAVAAIARRIEEKTTVLTQELGALQARVHDVEEQAEQWRKHALTDGLTQLPNRRAAEIALEQLMQRQSRGGGSYVVRIADIDHFKKVNDSHGHIVGDAVLKFVAVTLRKHIRGDDFVARWGGEEFLVLFCNADLTTSTDICERIKTELQSRKFTLRDTGRPIGSVTISIGLTPLHQNDTMSSVIARADNALYAAKAGGRNTIRVLS